MNESSTNSYLGIAGKHAPRIVLAVDESGEIIGCNLLAEKTIAESTVLLGQNISDILLLPDIEKNEALVDYYNRKIELIEKQFRSYTKFKNDNNKIVDVSLKKIDDPKKTYFLFYLESRVGIQVLSETALHQVADLVSGSDTENYFKHLVRDVSLTLSVDYALIGVLIDHGTAKIQTLAAFVNGAHVENFSYDLDHTPCKQVINGTYRCYEENAKELFPQDEMLTDLKMDGYAGIALYNTDKSSSGILAIGDRKPIVNPSVVESVLKIFSVRAASELERINITKEKTAAQKTLVSTEQRYKSIFNSAVNGFILWNTNREIIDINPAIWEAHGCTKEQYNKIGFFGFVHEDSKSLFDLINDCVENGKQFRTEIKQTRIDGSEFFSEMRGVPVKYDDQPLYLTVSVNLSEQKKSEEERIRLETQLRQAQKMESIGHLSGGIAHDFNNMLTGIVGNIDLALNRVETHGDEKIFKYLSRAKRSSMRARDLVQQLLTFSRGQKGEKAQLAFTPLIKECVKLIESTLPSSVFLNTSFSPNTLSVLCDPVQIEQVLMNLCINARDAMKSNGKLLIEVGSEQLKGEVCSSCKQTLDDNYATISVSDSGCGMPRVIVDRIFEPFFTTKEVGKGTGMGLSTVHGIMHEANGHILVDSVLDQGTTFKVLFPVTNSNKNDEVLNLAGENIAVAESARLSGRILVVDDDEDVCDYLNDLFENMGLAVDTNTNPIDARDYFINHNNYYALVITDQTMPNLKGVDLAKALRKHQPNIPIILHTGYADPELESQVLELGINELIKKPTDAKTLTNLVEKILKA